MKINVIGGGPAGLYSALLLKKQDPEAEIGVYERNRHDDTFGWGVVFSGATLANFQSADEKSHKAITAEFRSWDAIRTCIQGQWIECGGHQFSAISRRTLLLILQQRCRDVGVDLRFEAAVTSPAELEDADLVIAADGVHSGVRGFYGEALGAAVEMGASRFSWLGTTLPIDCFTFIFQPTEWGLFQVHAYPFSREQATWIVECTEETWLAAGLDKATQEDTVKVCQQVFAEHLQGHRLLTNRSIWRRFPTVNCQRWGLNNLVLLGDAAHTAHFSIGSGTKLAMEDAIALADAVATNTDVPTAIEAYEQVRRPSADQLQVVAEVSRLWFETCASRFDLPPLEFVYSLMTRSGQIGLDDLRQRDSSFVARLEQHRDEAG